MKKLYYLVIWFVVTLVFQNCSGCLFSECLENKYAFTEPVQFYPESKILHVGDTLWFYSGFSCFNMLNLVDGDSVSICDTPELVNRLGFEEYINDTFPSTPAADKFDCFALDGSVFSDPKHNPSIHRYVQYAKDTNRFELLIGIVLKESGNFGIYVGDIPNILWKKPERDCDDMCSFNFEITNADRHLEILYEFLDGKPISEAITVNYYCFEVVN